MNLGVFFFFPNGFEVSYKNNECSPVLTSIPMYVSTALTYMVAYRLGQVKRDRLILKVLKSGV